MSNQMGDTEVWLDAGLVYPHAFRLFRSEVTDLGRDFVSVGLSGVFERGDDAGALAANIATIDASRCKLCLPTCSLFLREAVQIIKSVNMRFSISLFGCGYP